MSILSIIIESQSILFSLILIIYIFLDRFTDSYIRKSYTRVLINNMLILICDIILTVNDISPGTLNLTMVKALCFCMYFLQPLLLIQMTIVIHRQIAAANKNLGKGWILVVHSLCTIANILLLLTPRFHLLYWYDDAGLYHRGPLFNVAMLIGGSSILIVVIVIFSQFKYLTKMQIFSQSALFIFPVIGIILQSFTSEGQFANIGLAASVLVFIVVTLYQFRHELLRQKTTILQDRIYLLDSQIKPHFIFNSLASIRYLIDDDPKLAKEAINHFSKYLRKDLNFEKGNQPVKIQDELELIQSYLYMQELRFSDILQVEYDIDTSLDFSLPFLSIQPLVENALKHGIQEKEGGGILTIRVYQEGAYNIIKVIDTGAGFDIEEVRARQKKLREELNDYSIGLANVRERLAIMCKGTLTFKSKIGEGTTATIKIPV